MVEAALWASFKSLPPKEAIVAVVSTDMILCNEIGSDRGRLQKKTRYGMSYIKRWNLVASSASMAAPQSSL